jgi:GNAT superfamily N-acetyltransferase
VAQSTPTPIKDNRPAWSPLAPDLEPRAAALLADCGSLGSLETAARAIAEVRHDLTGDLYGWREGDVLIAVYGLRQAGPSFELLWLAVAPSRRGQRYGRSALVDALRRCGRKPMTVWADESLKTWFESVGFKVVGRKPLPAGGYRYRLGWYAPRRPDEPGFGAHTVGTPPGADQQLR